MAYRIGVLYQHQYTLNHLVPHYERSCWFCIHTVGLRPYQNPLKQQPVELDGVSHESLVYTCAGSSIHKSLASAYITVALRPYQDPLKQQQPVELDGVTHGGLVPESVYT
jgi:hypothetical protein